MTSKRSSNPRRTGGAVSPATPAPVPPGGGQRVRLGDHLYGQIFDRIVTGDLNVGDKLPSESQICQQFGVSRPVVREALLRLRADGLITAHQGLGSFVSHQPATRVRSFTSAKDIAAYLRCQEVRVAIEGDAARLAALRRSPEQMAAIDAAHHSFARSLAAGQIEPADDLRFHASIAQGCGNALYGEILESIHESLMGFMRLSLSLTRTGSKQRARQVLDEHAIIVESIRERDSERARVAMIHHLTQARHRLVDRERDT